MDGIENKYILRLAQWGGWDYERFRNDWNYWSNG